MARQVLENGVILPAEYSDDWYDDMTSNLTKLDDVIGSDSEKLSSADVGAAALSNNYNDLDNLPTIPTVNDATLTIQKNGVDVQTFTANASSNVTANITVPTKTSDLTNDSNFVDTSNSAVASGITSAKVTDYDTHVADTDKHVTTADKTTWNTVTSKANDSDVVHKSGNETIAGIKNFTDDTYIKSLNFTNEVPSPSSSSSSIMPIITTITYGDSSPSVQARLNLRVTANGIKSLYPHENNQYALGLTSKKWSEVHGVTYYYGSSDVEFSTKFVTTDTAQDVTANKNFKGLITTSPDSTLWAINNKTTDDITSLAVNCIHIEGRPAGNLLDLSGGAWCVAQIGTGCFFFRQNNGTDIRYKHFPTNVVSKICVMSNDNKFISDLIPDTTNAYNLGNSSFKWSTINGVEPSSLSMPDLSNGIDISSYITISQPGVEDVHTSTYTPTVNGFISVCLSRNGVCGVGIEQGDMRTYAREVSRTDLNTRYAFAYLPVVKNVQVNIISCYADGIVSAKFFPCLGNV